jgi:hypothetical protein
VETPLPLELEPDVDEPFALRVIELSPAVRLGFQMISSTVEPDEFSIFSEMKDPEQLLEIPLTVTPVTVVAPPVAVVYVKSKAVSSKQFGVVTTPAPFSIFGISIWLAMANPAEVTKPAASAAMKM